MRNRYDILDFLHRNPSLDLAVIVEFCGGRKKIEPFVRHLNDGINTGDVVYRPAKFNAD